MSKFILFITFISFGFSGGWNLKKGSSFVKYEFRWINATKGFDITGNTVDLIGDYSSITHSLYAEYGLFDQVTVITNIPFSRSLELDSISTSGIGDVNLGLRYGFDSEGSTVFAFVVNASFETGDIAKLTSIGGSAIQFGLEIGHSLHEIGAYTTGYIAYNVRSGAGIQDELNIGAEFGYKLSDDLWGIFKLRNISVLGDLVAKIPPQFQSEYLAYSIEGAYSLSPTMGITAAFDGAFSAKNNYSAPTIAVGIFYKSL